MAEAVLRARRKFLVPEVIQTSGMDCGAAALKSILEGFGQHVSIGRLREACQTDIDGTSVDTIEAVANRLGFDAIQIQEPIDHFLVPEADLLPAIVIVSATSGLHFVVAWRRVGNFVLTMDPASGRRWIHVNEFVARAYQNTATIPAAVWREYAGSESFQKVLATRLKALGVNPAGLLRRALEDPTWRSLAALDAATRATADLTDAGVRTGREARGVLETLFEGGYEDAFLEEGRCPRHYWSAWPAEQTEHVDPDDASGSEEQLLVRGVVLVRMRVPDSDAEVGDDEQQAEAAGESGAAPASPLQSSVELRAAISEQVTSATSQLWSMARESGLLGPVALAIGLGTAASAAFIQALILRGLFDVGRRLGGAWQATAGAIAVVTFLLFAGLLDGPIVSLARRLGRGMDVGLRKRLLEKIPRLGDHYFRSRPRGDMAVRAHLISALRDVPGVVTRIVRLGLQFLVTAAGLVWLNTQHAPAVICLSVIILLVPIAGLPWLMERESSVHTHAGALMSHHLDGLLGLAPARTHGAETALLREHDSRLSAWSNAVQRRRVATLVLDAVQRVIAVIATVWIVVQAVRAAHDPRSLLLLLYWSLLLPTYATQLADTLLQFPALRSALLRALEPIGAPEEENTAMTPAVDPGASVGVAVAYRDVTVRAGGNTVLSNLSLSLQSGEHVAIVGTSGAGKSTMVGLLLGHQRISGGEVVIDGRPLDTATLEYLREHCAWLDPEIHIWNRSLLDNIEYGATDVGTSVSDVLDRADLVDVVERLPHGLQEALGEGGGLVSGGQGQRIRFARALRRRDARLVLVDEGFRGLDRDGRRILLKRAREAWPKATFLFVTHDIDMAVTFPRVVVVDRGRVVEDDAPATLLQRRASRLSRMLEAEVIQQRGLISSPIWRRVRVENGKIVEERGARR